MEVKHCFMKLSLRARHWRRKQRTIGEVPQPARGAVSAAFVGDASAGFSSLCTGTTALETLRPPSEEGRGQNAARTVLKLAIVKS